jgi:hypothetical protein
MHLENLYMYAALITDSLDIIIVDLQQYMKLFLTAKVIHTSFYIYIRGVPLKPQRK